MMRRILIRLGVFFLLFHFVVCSKTDNSGAASNAGSGGSSTVAPSALSYAGSPFAFARNAAISTQTPTVTGTVASCTSSPSLPTGLSINATSCAISGTPSSEQAAQAYTITATNSKGSTTANISITITPSTIADRVYGQAGSFTSNTLNNGGLSANSLRSPSGVTIDASGVYIVDTTNNRVLYFAGSSTTASRVYGQGGNLTIGNCNLGGISADSLCTPTAVAVDAGGIYISDLGNCRVLYYSGTSTTASRVYGQAGSYTTNTNNKGGLSASSLSSVRHVDVETGGVYIADTGNHRVLYYASTSTVASRVYGQAGSFTVGTGNNGGVSANSLLDPYGVAVDSGGVYIADYNNSRVLYYAGTSTTASRVYGQSGSFTTNTSNNGGISANSLSNPFSVVLETGGVYIADYTNSRVLYYAGTNTTSSRMYGGVFAIGADGLWSPSDIAVSSGRVYIADTGNHRVLSY